MRTRAARTPNASPSITASRAAVPPATSVMQTLNACRCWDAVRTVIVPSTRPALTDSVSHRASAERMPSVRCSTIALSAAARPATRATQPVRRAVDRRAIRVSRIRAVWAPSANWTEGIRSVCVRVAPPAIRLSSASPRVIVASRIRVVRTVVVAAMPAYQTASVCPSLRDSRRSSRVHRRRIHAIRRHADRILSARSCRTDSPSVRASVDISNRRIRFEDVCSRAIRAIRHRVESGRFVMQVASRCASARSRWSGIRFGNADHQLWIRRCVRRDRVVLMPSA